MMDYWGGYPGYVWPYYTYYQNHAPWTQPIPHHHLPPGAMSAPGRNLALQGVVPQARRARSSEPELELNPLLGGRRRPTIIWDVAYPPPSAQRIRSDGTVVKMTPPKLDEPVTRPPVQRMRIVSDDFPWDIIIDIPPPGIQAGEVVSINIVLESIYGLLHEPLDPEEWDDIDEATQRKIYKAMLDRLRKKPPSIHPSSKILKIDYLLEKTLFMGLKPAGPRQEDWLLSLGVSRA